MLTIASPYRETTSQFGYSRFPHNPTAASVEKADKYAAHSLRILVPLDGSALAEAAVEPAAQLIAALAAPTQCELHLLRVVDLPTAYGRMKSQAHISDSMQEEARKEAETYVQAMAERLRETTFAAFKLNIT